MATEQLGVGDDTVTRVIPGPISAGGPVFGNGVTSAPTITTVTTTSTADLLTAVNSVINALDALGLVVKAAP